MANLYFPQLASGALVQYPVSKEKTVRTIRNVMADGRLISYPDTGASTIKWNLSYRGLSAIEAASLKALFDACEGQLRPFTFIDPTGNLLASSSDLTNLVWKRSSLVHITAELPSPDGMSNGFRIVNNGQSPEELYQTLAIPARYQYCFSIYITSADSPTPTILLRGSSEQVQTALPVGDGNWTRIAVVGQLNESGSSLTVALRLEPGQALLAYGPQLEAQITHSSYRPTANIGAIYPNTFWSSNEIKISADEPNSYSTEIEIETAV